MKVEQIAERSEKVEDGAEILDSLVLYVRRFVSLTDSQARTVALWIALTYCLVVFDCTPYLHVSSAEKESGKTRLLEVLRVLVEKPWLTGRVTAAVLTRKIDVECPTLLLDESDTAFNAEHEYGEALRGVLNTGYRRGGTASCCVGQGASITYKDFSTFCCKAIAGLGTLPDTVAGRSIPIRLKRARRGTVEKFREREAEREASEIVARLSSWCQANLEKLRDARPEIPERLTDRQADVCEPLLVIADLAGRDWPQAARRALLELCAKAQVQDDSFGVKLLTDIRCILQPCDESGDFLSPLERIASCDLAEALGNVEERPWAEWGKAQKPITQPQLARLLGRFDIQPKTVRLPDGRRLKGYEREQFEEVWALYLPPDDLPPSHTSDSSRDIVTSEQNSGESGNFQTVTATQRHTSENEVSAHINAGCHGVTVQEGTTKGVTLSETMARLGLSAEHHPQWSEAELQILLKDNERKGWPPPLN